MNNVFINVSDNISDYETIKQILGQLPRETINSVVPECYWNMMAHYTESVLYDIPEDEICLPKNYVIPEDDLSSSIKDLYIICSAAMSYDLNNINESSINLHSQPGKAEVIDMLSAALVDIHVIFNSYINNDGPNSTMNDYMSISLNSLSSFIKKNYGLNLTPPAILDKKTGRYKTEPTLRDLFCSLDDDMCRYWLPCYPLSDYAHKVRMSFWHLFYWFFIPVCLQIDELQSFRKRIWLKK